MRWMNEAILEFLKELDEKGISWGMVITCLILFNKIQRNKEFRLRDQRVERNQRRIMEHLGVEGEWASPPKTLKQMALQSLRGLYSSSPGVTPLEKLFRRRKMINQSINWITLFAAILGAIKLILQAAGIDIPDDTINEIVNGAAAIGTVIGIALSHRKPKAIETGATANEYSEPSITIKSNK